MRWAMLASGALLVAMAFVSRMQQRKIESLQALLAELVRVMADQALAAASAELSTARGEWLSLDVAVLPDCDCPACAKGRERRN